MDRRGGRLLVAYSNSGNYVATTAEYLASFGRYSSWDVHYLHVTHGAEPAVDLSEFDAVLQSYCVRLPMDLYVSPAWVQMLTEYQGIKILSVQDEYDRTNRLKAAIKEIGFDVVMTCVAPFQRERVYPKAEFPDTEFVQVLTGYVPSRLPTGRTLQLSDRPIVLGYRGRDISARYGRLAFDKIEIGRAMKAVCEERHIPHDIAWGEGDRLHGDAWYKWIGQCRANLATESGSNAFDWDGEIEAELLARGGSEAEWGPFLEWLAPREADFNMGQVSPRIFEAAAMRTALVCYPGHYSGVIAPYEHFIPLERDLSNVDDVLRRLEDTDAVQRMVTRAWYDLVANGTYSYLRFVENTDDWLFSLTEARGAAMRDRWAGKAGDMPIHDCPEARSMVERPTRKPHHPLVFTFKHMSLQNSRLREALARQTNILSAMMARMRQENADHSEQLSEARGALVRQHRGANGATLDLPS